MSGDCLDRPYRRCQLPIHELWQRAYLQQRTIMPPIFGGFNLNRPCKASSVQVLNARSLGPSSCETSGAASFSFLTVISLYFCSWSFCFCSCIRWILQTAFFLIFICRQVSKDAEGKRLEYCMHSRSFFSRIAFWKDLADLTYSLRLKINTIIEFKLCPTKNTTFDPPTTKDKAISEIFLQKTTNTSSTHHER